MRVRCDKMAEWMADEMTTPLIVSNGGGVNSAAMLVGMHERGIRPDLVLFADTGDEKPETYESLVALNRWCESVHMPRTITVRNGGKHKTLMDSCLANGTLPSKAYGFPGCSVKFKIQVMDKYVGSWEPAMRCWDSGGRVVRVIGYDSGEGHRSDVTGSKKYEYRYLLREWGWRRSDCVEALTRWNIPVPIKSACYYCPSSKPHEVLWLKREHPDLFEKALAMERNAAQYNDVVRGLGRHWSWEEVAKADADQFKLFVEPVDTPCMCFDGEDDEATA